MATRIVDNSGDEFPELFEVLTGKSRVEKCKRPLVRSTCRRVPRAANQGLRLTSDTIHNDDSRNENEKDFKRVWQDRPEGSSTKGFGKQSGKNFDTGKENDGCEAKTPRTKRRLLRKRADNPLLRPLNGRDISIASSDFLGETPQSRIQSKFKRKSKGADRGDRLDLPEEDGLRDFIGHENSFVEDGGSLLEVAPPRSIRRLVRGRKPRGLSPVPGQLDLALASSTVDDESQETIQSASGEGISGGEENSEEEEVHERVRGPTDRLRARERTQQHKGEKSQRLHKGSDLNSEVDDPFALLQYSPSENMPRKVSKSTRGSTPPPSPSNTFLASPKRLPRIPLTPHRPSMDNFWSQKIVNEWNDEYSPPKALQPLPSYRPQPGGSSGDVCSPKKSPRKQIPTALAAKKLFAQRKHKLAQDFLAELDRTITNGEISRLAASTGGVKILWSKKLNTTAGRANWKRETIRSTTHRADSMPPPITYRHHAGIELAEKVIDDEDRLLNVIAHEFCHLANFMISNIKTNPHGKEFKAWAVRCSQQFGDRGVEVTIKHSYVIDYKYVWLCLNCGIEFKRHSRSIDPVLHQCGSCKSKLLQIKPPPRKGAAKGNEYQIFIKENMKRIMAENPGSPRKDIMGLVGKKYKEHMASRLINKDDSESVSIEDSVGGTGDSPVDSVARKLDFLDLTNP